jgi:hypothetical protein
MVLKEGVEADAAAGIHDDECKKYLLIRSSVNNPTVTPSILREMQSGRNWKHWAGWSSSAMMWQMQKSHINLPGKGFLRLKNSLDLGRLRVYRDDNM